MKNFNKFGDEKRSLKLDIEEILKYMRLLHPRLRIWKYGQIVWIWKYKGGPQKPRIIFWRAGPLQYRLPQLGKCSRNLSIVCIPAGIVVRGVQLQWIFPEHCYNTFAHFMMADLQAHLPTPHWVFSSFWPKTAWPLCPTLPIHQISPGANFFCLFPQMKKSSKGSVLPMWKRWNKKHQKH